MNDNEGVIAMGKRKLSDDEYDRVRMESLHELIDRACAAKPTFLCTPNTESMTISRNSYGQWTAKIGDGWGISSPDPYVIPADAEWEVWVRPVVRWEKQGVKT